MDDRTLLRIAVGVVVLVLLVVEGGTLLGLIGSHLGGDGATTPEQPTTTEAPTPPVTTTRTTTPAVTLVRAGHPGGGRVSLDLDCLR